MPSRLELADLLLIAAAIFDLPAERLARVVDAAAAESALAAPFAAFEGVDFYPDPAERAAICCSRLIRNHPFPDGNKLVAYECMREMLERDGVPWPGPGEVGEIAGTVEALAAREISEREFVAWVRTRTEL